MVRAEELKRAKEEELKLLGLAAYESMVYRTLIENKIPMKAMKISHESGVPSARVYNVLSDLEKKGLVKKLEEPSLMEEPFLKVRHEPPTKRQKLLIQKLLKEARDAGYAVRLSPFYGRKWKRDGKKWSATTSPVGLKPAYFVAVAPKKRVDETIRELEKKIKALEKLRGII